ncbi:MAG: YnbE family lipoprotein [Sphingomonadales bacterium]|nr:YnbE family lipoprotein [Sphingomonadales bacterium]MBD3775016.1 YnbE family lipoprotein [Paracoccaceae bacterium]
MNHAELTPRGAAATSFPTERRVRSVRRVVNIMPVLLGGTAMLGGCINVSAPDKPIVIELNINIRQEVIYRLANDANNTIEENADIF